MLLKQTTDDKVNGNDIGFKGQAFAIGPGIQYADKNWSIEAKFLKRNRSRISSRRPYQLAKIDLGFLKHINA